MIITVTLNPAIDQTIEIDGLQIGDTNRVLANRWDIGGKGINVARALKELGYEPLAAGFAPGALGRMIEDQLFDSGIGCEFVSVPGETRTNITILDRGSHAHTALAAPGPSVTPEASRALSTRLGRRLRPGSWLVLAGSVPPPGEPTLYAELVEVAARHECFTALDADGPVVQRLLEMGARPTLLKINEQELERLMGTPMRSEEAVTAAAEWLQGRGIRDVVVTRGEAGAVAVTADGRFRALPPPVEVISALGAGDGFLAGLLLGLVRTSDWGYALRLAAACGAAVCCASGPACRDVEVYALLAGARVESLGEPVAALT